MFPELHPVARFGDAGCGQSRERDRLVACGRPFPGIALYLSTKERAMHAQIVKRALLACFALLFVVAMAGAVQAGPLHFSVSKAQAGGIGHGQEEIVFHFTVANTTSHEFIRRLNSVTVEVTGDLGNGRQEK